MATYCRGDSHIPPAVLKIKFRLITSGQYIKLVAKESETMIYQNIAGLNVLIIKC